MSDFETFVLEPANREAATAARAMADGTGVPDRPLIVLGPPGSGKTELLQAIADRLAARHPSAQVELLVPDALAERYRGALVMGRGEGLRAELAGADLVLLDDVERLARHRDCQGLVADLLDSRRQAGRGTVVATGRPVEKLDGLDARLRRRLAEGTTVSLALPGPAVRAEILRRRLAGRPGALPEDVVRGLAAAEFPSMREYTGALSRLVAFQEASALPLSPADAMLLIGAPSPRGAPDPGGETAPEPAPALPAEAAPPGGQDEFAAFLSEVTATVSEQVDRWRRRVEEAVQRWRGEGLRTGRLEALLQEELSADPEPVLAAFAEDARELLGLAREAVEHAPDLAGTELFHDPDQLAAARALCEEARGGAGPLTAPLTQYRFEALAEGESNRGALEAARELLAQPGQGNRPLVIWGGPGVGKSHFLHGLGNALAIRGVGRVVCLGGPAFVAELAACADAGALAAWRRRYRWVGALLLDDLHLLAGETGAQEELAALIAELQEGHRPMAIASARALGELDGLAPRLRSLLDSGVVVELGPPDREIRLAVVKRLLSGSPAPRDAALADYLAGRPAESVRAVQGLVAQVLEGAAAQHVAPSPALAREVLEARDLGAERSPLVSGPVRTSGIYAPGMGLLRSREKMIDEWPVLTDRLMAELR
jgi:chromosomal replication initiation ATPase DnaA